ncbi:hypothetical protein PV682_42135 [Streptomyces niveiscabiei]|nr:hypothetical protein [Streptomyces niveiscabiei]MDX3387995.1 hypothetical protein [Streptomyces niveiscabiei]
MTEDVGCPGCEECSVELFLPMQDALPFEITPGDDLDPFEQPKQHPH